MILAVEKRNVLQRACRTTHTQPRFQPGRPRLVCEMRLVERRSLPCTAQEMY